VRRSPRTLLHCRPARPGIDGGGEERADAPRQRLRARSGASAPCARDGRSAAPSGGPDPHRPRTAGFHQICSASGRRPAG